YQVLLAEPEIVALNVPERALRDRLLERALDREPVAHRRRGLKPSEWTGLLGHGFDPRPARASWKLGPPVRPLRLLTLTSTARSRRSLVLIRRVRSSSRAGLVSNSSAAHFTRSRSSPLSTPSPPNASASSAIFLSRWAVRWALVSLPPGFGLG